MPSTLIMRLLESKRFMENVKVVASRLFFSPITTPLAFPTHSRLLHSLPSYSGINLALKYHEQVPQVSMIRMRAVQYKVSIFLVKFHHLIALAGLKKD